MALFARNFSDITADTLSELSRNTNITKLSAGAKARALLDAINKRVSEAYQVFDLNLTKAYVSAAPGQYLDLIGELVGLTRTAGVAASVSAGMQVIKFFVDTGTFGDINSSQDIIVPAGQRVSSVSGNLGIVYKTTTQAILRASDSEQFLGVEAMSTGASANVGSNTLIYHDFGNYTDVLDNTLKVTNIHPIANGANLESDANFRFRIANRVLEVEAANETSIRLAALSTPGVADVIVLPRYKGIGTFGLLIESIAPTVSEDLIDNVQGRISLVQGLGTIAYVRKPYEAGIAIKTTIQYATRLDDTSLTEIEYGLDQNIRNFIASLGIGDPFIINQLVSQMFRVSSSIKNIGIAGTPLEEVYVYRDSRVEDSRIKEKLLGDYTPDYDERVIVEPSLSNPFIFNRSFARR